MAVDREKAWELVQIKGLTAWANTYLDSSMSIKNLETDMTDGVRLCLLTEGVKSRMDTEIARKKIGPWTRDPKHRMQKIENCNLALGFLKNEVKVRLMQGATDFVGSQEGDHANLKMVLGCLWSTFRRTLNIDPNSSISEEYAALLDWVRDLVGNYPGVEIKGMRDTWADGLVFSAMLDKAGVKEVNFRSLDKGQGAKNLQAAFDLAEKHFKIPQLLEIQDLVQCIPEERSVAFYLNLMRHAMADTMEKNKTKNTMHELELRLQQEAEERKRLEDELAKYRREKEEALRRLQKEQEETMLKLKLEDLLHTDESALLEEKVSCLSMLLEDEEDEQRAKRLKEQMEEAMRARQELEELKKKLRQGNPELLKQLEDAEERRRQLQAELEEMRKRVQKELERRKRRGKAAVELQAEVDALKNQAIVQQTARYGLDVLKRGLEEHLEDMYKWREVTSDDGEVLNQVFDLQQYLNKLKGKKFEEQLDVLSQSLQAENQTVRKLLKMKDDTMDLNDQFIKSGWLEIKDTVKNKEWKKYYFNLRSAKLTYHRTDSTDRSVGGVNVDEATLKAPADVDGKPTVELKFSDYTMLIGAETADEAKKWYDCLVSERTYARYLKSLPADKRPDLRITTLVRAANLTSICIDGLALGESEIVAIAHALRHHSTIETVLLTNSGLTDASTKKLAGELDDLKKVRTVDLSHNKIGSSAAALAKALRSAKALQTLNLSHNQLDAASVQELASLPVKELDLSNNPSLGDEGVKVLCKCLAGSKVTHVLVQNCGVTDAGASALAELLVANTQIQKVDASGNQIGDAGAVALSKVLEGAHALSHLDLSKNAIGSAGASALVAATPDSAVHKLNISGNKIVGQLPIDANLKVESIQVSK